MKTKMTLMERIRCCTAGRRQKRAEGIERDITAAIHEANIEWCEDRTKAGIAERIHELIKNGAPVPEGIVEKAINLYWNHGCSTEGYCNEQSHIIACAELANYLGKREDEMKFYTHAAREMIYRAQICTQRGFYPNWNRTLALTKTYFHAAAKAAEEIGQPEKAARLFKNAEKVRIINTCGAYEDPLVASRLKDALKEPINSGYLFSLQISRMFDVYTRYPVLRDFDFEMDLKPELLR
ncbi:MAG: hypothetical protein KJ955_03840 [Nanoarchaeota archaeon]|nr:hypothetical protein [Nanoarchaeota archaeon]